MKIHIFHNISKWKNGFLCEVENVSDIVGKNIITLENPTQRNRMVTNRLDIVCEIAKQYERRLYQRV